MSTMRYIPGDIVGVYTIIDRFPGNKDKLLCRCNICGSVVDVFVSNIHRQKMCRNCRQSNNIKPKADLSGQKFGRLTVIGWVQHNGRGTWKCVCDCGSQVLVKTNSLTSGHTKSCGCYMRERTSESNSRNLSGQRFGRLTVIKRADNYQVPSGQRLTKYVCLCDCGNEVEVLSSNLVTGNTTSCGCLGSSKGEFYTQEFLHSNNVPFTKQQTFRDLRSKKNAMLKFDFALWSGNRLICLVEYQGEQHYYPPSRRKTFGELQRNETDALKREYCQKHELKLFELRFDDDLSNRLNEVLNYYLKNK